LTYPEYGFIVDTMSAAIPAVFFTDAFWLGVGLTLLLLSIVYAGARLACAFWEARDR